MTKTKLRPPTLAEVEAIAPEVARWAEATVGPDVPQLIRRGRPAKGVQVEPMVVKSVKVRPSVWARLEAMARQHGQTVNAFVAGQLEGLTRKA